jgi:hypothetical protein
MGQSCCVPPDDVVEYNSRSEIATDKNTSPADLVDDINKSEREEPTQVTAAATDDPPPGRALTKTRSLQFRERVSVVGTDGQELQAISIKRGDGGDPGWGL